MMKILTILLFCSQAVFAGSYYVSNVGSDANSGAIGNPFATIGKANTVAISGDFVYLERGNSWNEKVYPISGVTYDAYGTGINPIITGFQTVTGFTNVGNIWTATVSSFVNGLNMVTINGNVGIKARYPNTGYIVFSSSIGDSILIAPTLSGTPDYTGKEIVTRTASWVIDVRKVIYQHGDTLKVTHLTYAPGAGSGGGRGLFFQNDSSFLDTNNEFSYDSLHGTLEVYSTSSPSVQIADIDTLMWLRRNSFLTFNNISFIGSNKVTVQLDTCSNILFNNSSFNYCGAITFRGIKSSYISITNSTVNNSLSNAFLLRGSSPTSAMVDTCNNNTITYNSLKNTGVYAGMGGSGNDQYMGIRVAGTNNNISYNRIDSVGYIPIYFVGKNTNIVYNYISNYSLNKDDGGAIYTNVNNAYYPSTFDTLSLIANNITINGTGAALGTSIAASASGVYLDNQTKYVTVKNNTIINAYISAINLNGNYNNIIMDNTIVDSTGDCVFINNYATPVTNTAISGNIFYQKNNGFYTYNNSHKYDLSGYGNSMDSNIHLRPTLQTTIIYIGLSSPRSSLYTFSDFVDSTGYEANGAQLPSNITGSLPILYYNPTMKDSVIYLNGLRINAKGALRNNAVLLKPFQSELLFKANYELLKTKFSIGTLRFTN